MCWGPVFGEQESNLQWPAFGHCVEKIEHGHDRVPYCPWWFVSIEESMCHSTAADFLERDPNPEARAQLSEITNFDLGVLGKLGGIEGAIATSVS